MTLEEQMAQDLFGGKLMFHATARCGRETHILRTESAVEALAYAEEGTEGGTVAFLRDDTLVAYKEVAAK